MTTKQKIFIEEKLKGKSGKEAAEIAGYSKKSARIRASENGTKSNIKSELDKRTKEIEAKTNITCKELLDKFLSNSDLAISLPKPQISAGNQALENIGKHIGFYAEDNKQKSEGFKALLDALE